PGQSAGVAEPVSGERGDDGSPTGLGGASVAKGVVRKPQVIVRAHAELLIGVALGDGTGLETERRDFGGTTAYDETGAQVDPHATEPLPIVEWPRERLPVAEMPHNLGQATERPERVAEVEPHVDGLSQRFGRLRHVLERGERLLEETDRLAVRRTRHGLHSGPLEEGDGLRPQLSLAKVQPQRGQ